MSAWWDGWSWVNSGFLSIAKTLEVLPMKMGKTALVFLATIPASVEELALTVKNARVRFVSGSGKNLTVKVSNPDAWRFVAEAGVFLQKGPRQTVSAEAGTDDVVVGRADVVIGGGGRARQVTVGDGGVFIGGSVKGGVINTGTVINTGGGAYFGGPVVCGGDLILGDKICSDNSDSAEPECIEITVPLGYAGSLNLVWEGSLEADLGDWAGGSISLSGSGSASIDAGRLENLEVFEVKVSGSSHLHCKSIRAAVFSYEGAGGGSGDLGHLHAEVVNVLVSGVCRLSVNSGFARCGSVEAGGFSTLAFRGDFKKLRTKRSITAALTVD